MGATDYVMLRKLTVQEGEPIDGILQRACNELRGLGEKALLQLRLIGTGSTDAGGNYSARLTPAGTFAHADSTTRPTLAIITTTDVFRRLANGTYSPVQAYLDGDLRLHGNVDVAKRMLLHLAGSGTQVTVCPLLTNESWRLDGPGIGSLTVTGKFFTPSGTVEIVYDWGGGRYQRITIADSQGSFTITEGSLFCGDIPGHPGVGVIVTATDLSSAKSTTQNYATPCS